MGTVLYMLVNDCMMLFISQDNKDNLNQTSEGLIYMPEQALAILNGSQDTRLGTKKAPYDHCQTMHNLKQYLPI